MMLNIQDYRSLIKVLIHLIVSPKGNKRNVFEAVSRGHLCRRLCRNLEKFNQFVFLTTGWPKNLSRGENS